MNPYTDNIWSDLLQTINPVISDPLFLKIFVIIFLGLLFFVLSCLYRRWSAFVRNDISSAKKHRRYIALGLAFVALLNVELCCILYEPPHLQFVDSFIGFCINNIFGVVLLWGIWRTFQAKQDQKIRGGLRTFWEVLFLAEILLESLLDIAVLLTISGGTSASFVEKVFSGISNVSSNFILTIVMGVVAWLTYLANRESINKPNFAIFFVDNSLYNFVSDKELNKIKKQHKREKTLKKLLGGIFRVRTLEKLLGGIFRVRTLERFFWGLFRDQKRRWESENESKIIEVVPWFAGKHPLNYAEDAEITISICIKNVPPFNSVFKSGTAGSNVTVFFYMPPNIVPFRAYRRDSSAENRQVLETCEYGIFKGRSYIAVPVVFNVSPPAITMLSTGEAVVIEITSRIEKTLSKEYCKHLHSVGIQMTSSEGVKSDVKWLYLKFCEIDIDDSNAKVICSNEEKEDWKNSCERLFLSLTDQQSRGWVSPNTSNQDNRERTTGENRDRTAGKIWQEAVENLLEKPDSFFSKLAKTVNEEASTLPGRYKYHKEGEERNWKEVKNKNFYYDILSKLLSSIWYLLTKELIPASPNFQTEYKINKKSAFDLSNSDYGWTNYDQKFKVVDPVFEDYEGHMKEYFRNQVQYFNSASINAQIRAFYQKINKFKCESIKNREDWEILNGNGNEENQKRRKRKTEIIEKSEEYKSKNEFDIKEFIEDYVCIHQEQLRELCHNRTNSRSTPQRAFPLASVLPANGSVGVLELDCHRGDVGLALLNLDFVLADSENYFTQNFQDFIGDNWILRWVCNPIQKYFGVADTLDNDEDWALAQWGPHTEMRRKLRRFHYDFRSGNTERFKRIKADLSDVDSYVMEAVGFLKDMDNLVVLTSYALCFVPFDKRRRLAQAIRAIQEYYLASNPKGRFFWYNQGRSVDEIFNEDSSNEIANRFYLGEMCFKGAFLFGVDLLQLNNDLHTQWSSPRFSILCQESNEPECLKFVKTRRSESGTLSNDSQKSTPLPWKNCGLYRVDEYDVLVEGESEKVQETAIYSNIIFPMLDNPGAEAGVVQKRLEEQKMCYVGSGSKVIGNLADMEKCRVKWREKGIPTLESVVCDRSVCDSSTNIRDFCSSLPTRLNLEKNEGIKIIPPLSGIDRTGESAEEDSTSDFPDFSSSIAKKLQKYKKFVIEPQRKLEDKECVIHIPIIGTGLKAIALPAYLNKDLIDPETGTFIRMGEKGSEKVDRRKVINMAKRLALDVYRISKCRDFGVVEFVYSKRLGLQASRIQPLPYFWKYDADTRPEKIVQNSNSPKEKRECEVIGLPEEALKNGFFYSWDEFYQTVNPGSDKNSEDKSINTLLSVLCNMAQRGETIHREKDYGNTTSQEEITRRDEGDRRRFMHVLNYDKGEKKR